MARRQKITSARIYPQRQRRTKVKTCALEGCDQPAQKTCIFCNWHQPTLFSALDNSDEQPAGQGRREP